MTGNNWTTAQLIFPPNVRSDSSERLLRSEFIQSDTVWSDRVGQPRPVDASALRTTAKGTVFCLILPISRKVPLKNGREMWVRIGIFVGGNYFGT